MRYFQFTLGPVQGFVAQARRTRDFWAGSFLLSYLTGHAMLAVLNNEGGEIVFPVVQDSRGSSIIDPLLEAIAALQAGKSCKFPAVGSIPNRFLARVPDDFQGEFCVDAVDEAWQTIAGKIWRKYVSPVAVLGRDTEKIWNRQIRNFWEISWAFGEETDLLDRRKNWRIHIPPDEPGDKCTLMGNWQELSGYMRIADTSGQRRFWEKLSAQTPGEDFRDDERLCGMALIKRLFPYLLKERAGLTSVAYPSTPYLAAVPWLSAIIANPTEYETIRKFVNAAHPKMFGHENSAAFFNTVNLAIDVDKLIKLDGNCFFSSTLENDNLWPTNIDRKCRWQMAELLKEFQTEPLSPFYALLIMDGDHIGSLLSSQPGSRSKLSRALSDFSMQAENIIGRYQGITVYAGGDDVLALLPMDKALAAAAALRECYADCFKKMEIAATISAGIVYAHHHAPLRQIIAKAHQILDEEAKEKTGRNALAAAVWKTGGTVINWSAPWEVQHAGEGTVKAVDKIHSLTENYRNKQISNSWLYDIRRLFGNLRDNDFELSEDMKDIHIQKVLAADLVQNRETDIPVEKAEAVVQDLMSVCLRQTRNHAGEVYINNRTFSLNGALLIKFLATKGVAV